MRPQVSIIMPVFNAEPYLAQAMVSILNQTMTDFELIIVNDCSTDNSLRIIQSFADPRITIHTNERNMGIVVSLNRAYAHCQAPFIARMDADDISLPDRLQTQVEWMHAHPETIVLGTTFFRIDQGGVAQEVVPVMLEDTDIRRELIFKSPFAHGSVMIRKSALDRMNVGSNIYREEFRYVEDYDLWVRLAPLGSFHNLPGALFMWRDTQNNTTHSRHEDLQIRTQIVSTTYHQSAQSTIISLLRKTPYKKFSTETADCQERVFAFSRRRTYVMSTLFLVREGLREKIVSPSLWLLLKALLMDPIVTIQEALLVLRQKAHV